MGLRRVRYLVDKGQSSYWQPTKAMRAAGFGARRLTGTSAQILAEAERLNSLWDEHRRGRVIKVAEIVSAPPPIPDSIGALIDLYRDAPEYLDRKPRTRQGYDYWLDIFRATDFGAIPVRALRPKAVKLYYQGTVRGRGLYAGYHMMIALRTLLSFGVSEDWLDSNPALKVTVTKPASRTVRWTDEQTRTIIAQAIADGYRSIALAVMVASWIAQRPSDVLALHWSNYDGATIELRQAKTGTQLPRLPVSADLKAWLDATPRSEIDPAHIIINKWTGRRYNHRTFLASFQEIRDRAGLPSDLHFADFRRTAATEIAEGGATDDEMRSVTGHKSRDVVSVYALPSDKTAANAMRKRVAGRTKPV